MNYTINKIIVAVDMSETSLHALDTAIALAKKHNATIYILNVIEAKYDYAADDIDALSVAELSNSKDVLNALIGSIQYNEHIKPSLIQKQGNVFECIIKTSLSEHADLIVMGTHGASGFRGGYIGTNTYTVIKHALCPVLIVPPRRTVLQFRKVLFPIRPVTGALAQYEVLCHFLTPLSSINVLGLSYRKLERETNVLDKIVNEIKADVEKDHVQIATAWGNGNAIAEDVLQYAHQYVPDLVVVTNVLDVTTKSGFIGPHAQKIINCSKAPVLTIKGLGVPSYI